MSRLLPAAVLAALLSLAPGPQAAAQQPSPGTPPLEAGVRVRVADPALGPRPLVGLVAGARGDSLAVYFNRRSAPDTLLLSGMRSIEVSRGSRPPGYVDGAVVGAGAGVMLGMAAAAAIRLAGGRDYPFEFLALLFVPPAAGLGVVGGVLSARPTEIWEPVRLGATVAAPF